MTQLKKPSFWFMVFLVLVALSFVVQSFAYNPDARLFPLVIGIPTAITGILIVLAEKWPGLIRRFDVTVGAKVKKVAPGIDAGDEAPKEQAEPISEAQANKRVLTLGAWMAGYMGVILLAGFTVANFLLPTAYMKVHAKSSWLHAIIVGALIAATIWVTFDYFMKANMFKGILFGEIVPPL